jgi:iron complex transport system permease protein
MKDRKTLLFLLLTSVFFAFVIALLFWGPVKIEWDLIVTLLQGNNHDSSGAAAIFWNYRLPKLVTATAAGGGLALSGLLMQTYFQNPLAGPFVLGVNSGATLGVAAWIMGVSILPVGFLPFASGHGIMMAAAVGATTTLAIIVLLSSWVTGKATLLIVGLIFGYIANGIINIVIITGSSQELQSLLLWSLGSFTRVSGGELTILSAVVGMGAMFALLIAKQLNVMLLGDHYARSLGVNVGRVKLMVIILTGTICGVTTALCGPVAFLGIIAPHLTKALFNSHDHRLLVPAVFLMGAVLAMSAELLLSLWPYFTLPLNAVLGLLGAPIVILYLLRRRSQTRQMD